MVVEIRRVNVVVVIVESGVVAVVEVGVVRTHAGFEDLPNSLDALRHPS